MSSGKIIKLILVAVSALFLTCRDTPRDNPFDPDSEVLIVEVLSPAQGSSFTTGHPISFEAAAQTGFDNQQAMGEYLWKSDISGVLSRQRTFKASLPAGAHRITVTVTDSTGRRGNSTLLLNIRSADEYGVELVVPSADTAFIKGTSFTPLAAEYLPEGTSVIGRSWNFGAGSGIPSSTQREPGAVLYDVAGIFPLIYQVVDARGRVAADTVMVEIVESSEPPVAQIYSPASDTVVSVGDSIYLEAVAMQTAGRITYKGWTYPQGSGLENRVDTVEVPGWVVMDIPGVFPLRFTANDLLGVSAGDTVTVTVNDTLPPPVSMIAQPPGDTTIVVGDSIYFRGQFTPPGIVGESHLWDWGGAGPAADSIAEPGWRTFSTAGAYTVTYTVLDRSERGAPDSVTVTANANQPPTAQISNPSGDISVGQGAAVAFAANDSDQENRITVRFWLWDPASGISPSAADSAKVPGVRTFNATGSFVVSYHVIDHQGLEAADSLTVTVTANQAPQAQIAAPSSDTTVYAWAPVAFMGSDSDDDGTIVSRQWDFGSGVSGDTTANPGEIMFSASGDYEIVYSVTDDDHTQGADTVRVTVNANNRPQAMIISPVGNISISAGDSLSFLATDFDSDGSVVTRVWNYGVGSGLAPDSVAIPDYRTFSNPGSFTVEYRVIDNVGGVTADSLHVTVGP